MKLLYTPDEQNDRPIIGPRTCRVIDLLMASEIIVRNCVLSISYYAPQRMKERDGRER